jgi:hypothetical protein
MKYKDIVENTGKYYFILINGKKNIVLSSDNNLSESKEKAIKLIEEKEEEYEDLFIAKLSIKVISNKLKKLNEESKIKAIGGPIEVIINFFQINKNKFSKIKNNNLDNNIFITDNFLQKYNFNEKVLKKIVTLTFNNKLKNDIFEINTIDEHIK